MLEFVSFVVLYQLAFLTSTVTMQFVLVWNSSSFLYSSIYLFFSKPTFEVEGISLILRTLALRVFRLTLLFTHSLTLFYCCLLYFRFLNCLSQTRFRPFSSEFVQSVFTFRFYTSPLQPNLKKSFSFLIPLRIHNYSLHISPFQTHTTLFLFFFLNFQTENSLLHYAYLHTLLVFANTVQSDVFSTR